MEVFSMNSGDDGQWQFGANMIAHEGGVGIGVIPVIPTTN